MGMSTHKIKGEDYYQCRDVKAERDKLLEEVAELLDRLEAAEKERDEFKRECFGHISDNSLLRAKIEQMEKQEPVATVRINAINGNPSVDFVPGLHYLHHNDKLYALPGAKGE